MVNTNPRVKLQSLSAGSEHVATSRAVVGIAVGFLLFCCSCSNKELVRANSIKMRDLILATHYAVSNDSFPAAYNQDAAGKPLLSWRVHLLPFIDLKYKPLYDRFRLDEPWDSEHNRTLIDQMPDCYEHVKLKTPPGHTVYVSAPGVDSIWQAPTDDSQRPAGIPFDEIFQHDGTTNTVAIIEVAASQAVVWTKPEPRDIDVDQFCENLEPIWGASSMVCMGDGGVFLLKTDLPGETWAALMSVRDGKPVLITDLLNR